MLLVAHRHNTPLSCLAAQGELNRRERLNLQPLLLDTVIPKDRKQKSEQMEFRVGEREVEVKVTKRPSASEREHWAEVTVAK